MKPRARILTLLPLSSAHGSGVLRGFIDFSRNENWSVSISNRRDGTDVPTLLKERARYDAVVGAFHQIESVRAARKLSHKILASGITFPQQNLPGVSTDSEAIGAMAADFFSARGYRHFAFYGFRARLHCRARWQGFQKKLAALGHDRVPLRRMHPWTLSYGQWEEDLRKWLVGLPRPCALFTATDWLAQRILEAAPECGLRIPDDIAVLGVDNNEVLIRLRDISLSSIVCPHFEMGQALGHMLKNYLAGQEPPQEHIRFQPIVVVSRGSTDSLAFEDEVLLRLVDFLRDTPTFPANVELLAGHLGMNRRTLERRAKDAGSLSISNLIHAVKAEQAADLCRQTDLGTESIAEAVGYGSIDTLKRAFHERYQRNITDFRKSLK